MTPQGLLDVRDLTVQFRVEGRTIHAVSHVSFTIPPKQIVGLVGESGCGKSVTALTLTKLLPRPPAEIVSGEVWFEGQDLLTLEGDSLRRVRGRRIAYIFQDPASSLNPVLSIGDQILEVFAWRRGLKGAGAVDAATKLLTRVGLPAPEDQLQAYPHQLSGGMRQRVMIAMALASNPALLVADEPTTALDVTIQAQILRLLQEVRDLFGVSVLLITHDLGLVARCADHLLVMYAGRIMEDAPAEAMYRRPRHPYTAGLMACLPDPARRKAPLTTIAGAVADPSQLPRGCTFHPRCPLVEDRCRLDEPPLEPRSAGHLVRCIKEAARAAQ